MNARHKLMLSGFTLIELLIVISICGLLMQLFVPAVQNAREAARRTQCASNLRQLAIAESNFESAKKSFSPGFSLKPRHNFVQYLLPQLEQQALFDKYDFKQDWNAGPNKDSTNIELAVLQCPTAPRDYPYLSDYGVCAHISEDLQDELVADGLIRERSDLIGVLRGSPVETSKITDGLSNTVMFCETGGRPDHYVLGQLKKVNTITGSRWATPAGRFDLNYRCDGVKLKMGSQLFNCTSRNEINSFHGDGANFAFADGSTRFLIQDIDPDSFVSLITAGAGD